MAIRVRTDRSTTLIRLGVGLALLGAIVVFLDPKTILASASAANGMWIAAALMLLPLNLFLESAKWKLLLTGSGFDCRLRESVGSILAGYALGFITPARLGDYAGRVLYLKDARKGALLVLAGLDRLYSIWIYALAGTAVLAFQLGGSLPGPGGIWWLTLVIGVLLTAVLGYFLLRPRSLYAMSSSILSRWSAGRWRRHVEAAGTLLPITGLGALLLSAARYAVFCTQFVFLLLAFDSSTALPVLYFGVALVFFVKTVIPSLTLFDLGIRESAAIFLLGFFSVQAEAAFSASLLLFAVNLALPALVGIAFVPRLRLARFGRKTRLAPHAAEAQSG